MVTIGKLAFDLNPIISYHKKIRNTTKWLLFISVAIVSLLVTQDAWAWGPATHLYYGMNILDQLSSLTGPIRSLLSTQSIPFLYGCVSADIVLAKKLGNAMTHCHRWDNGLTLIENTDNPRIKAFTLGYVSHLAADTISHNCYVPSKTIESFDSGILKHMYWELLFDKKLTSKKSIKLFKEIARGEFDDCDAYLESHIPTRIFDFSTNKRIFNQLLLLQGLSHWQKLWTGLSEKASKPLTNSEVHNYTNRSVDAIRSFLNEYRSTIYMNADPTGQERLRGANALRRHYKKSLKSFNPPLERTVKLAVERFAREPFEKIEIHEFKDNRKAA
jgi:hypothetical protein